jgi:hypothetical protein
VGCLRTCRATSAARPSRDQGVQQPPRHEPSRKGSPERNDGTDRSPGCRRFGGRQSNRASPCRRSRLRLRRWWFASGLLATAARNACLPSGSWRRRSAARARRSRPKPGRGIPQKRKPASGGRTQPGQQAAQHPNDCAAIIAPASWLLAQGGRLGGRSRGRRPG